MPREVRSMSMTIEQMRFEVAKLYPGYGWRDRVAKMPDKQILAIYTGKVLGKANTKGGGTNGR